MMKNYFLQSILLCLFFISCGDDSLPIDNNEDPNKEKNDSSNKAIINSLQFKKTNNDYLAEDITTAIVQDKKEISATIYLFLAPSEFDKDVTLNSLIEISENSTFVEKSIIVGKSTTEVPVEITSKKGTKLKYTLKLKIKYVKKELKKFLEVIDLRDLLLLSALKDNPVFKGFFSSINFSTMPKEGLMDAVSNLRVNAYLDKIFTLKDDKITAINFQHTKLKSIPSEIFNLKGIESLDFRYTEITEIPSEIKKFKKVRYLKIKGD